MAFQISAASACVRANSAAIATDLSGLKPPATACSSDPRQITYSVSPATPPAIGVLCVPKMPKATNRRSPKASVSSRPIQSIRPSRAKVRRQHTVDHHRGRPLGHDLPAVGGILRPPRPLTGARSPPQHAIGGGTGGPPNQSGGKSTPEIKRFTLSPSTTMPSAALVIQPVRGSRAPQIRPCAVLNATSSPIT